MKKSTRIAAALALAAIMTALLLVMNGCSAAADGSGGEGADGLPGIETSSSYAMGVGTGEGECAWDGVAMARGYQGTGATNSNGQLVGYYKDLGTGTQNLSTPTTNPNSPYKVTTGSALCVTSGSDPTTKAMQTLIGTYGCSAPFYFSSYKIDLSSSSCTWSNNSWSGCPDHANGYPQLCPYSAGLANYVASLGRMTNWNGQLSDMPSHFVYNPFSSSISIPTPQHGPTPSPPNGYVWVISWEDPYGCTSSGCMDYI